MIISNDDVWVIMSKDRGLIAKGNVRDRHLVPAADVHNKKRILTYTTKGKAESAMTVSGFYGQELIDGYKSRDDLSKHLEPVLVKLQMVSDDLGELPKKWISCKDELPEVGIEVEFYTYINVHRGVLNSDKKFHREYTHNNETYSVDEDLRSVRYWRHIQ